MVLRSAVHAFWISACSRSEGSVWYWGNEVDDEDEDEDEADTTVHKAALVQTTR